VTDLTQQILAALPKPNRVMAPVRWYGGKGHMARKLVPLIPPGRVYCEPYCGAASLFWHLRPRPVEVLNDLHSEIVNLFRTLQDPALFDELAHRLAWTPYSLAEFRKALAMEYAEELSAVDRAWAFFVRQNQGFSGIAETEGNWGRDFGSGCGMAKTTSDWRSRLATLGWWHERLTRVQLDCRDALEVIRYWDSPETVYYVDPPYAADTRAKGKHNVYRHEADDEHHRALVALLLGIQGNAVVSGYASPLYASLDAAGWTRHEFQTACCAAGRCRGSKIRGDDAAREHVPRTEVVWIKRPVQQFLGEMFDPTDTGKPTDGQDQN